MGNKAAFSGLSLRISPKESPRSGCCYVLPQQVCYRRSGCCWQRWSLPLGLFPGYFFVAFDKEARGSRWRSISGTRGVAGLIQQDYEHPLPIPTDELNRLRACEGLDGCHHLDEEEQNASWLAGKTMRPLEGSLRLLTGLCRVYDPRTDRVQLLMSLFGRDFVSWLPREQVEIVC